MTDFLCPACWRPVPSTISSCPQCHAPVAVLAAGPLHDRLFAALAHPDGDTAIRAALALVRRRDPESVQAVAALIRRFARAPHLVAGLLDALMFVDDPAAGSVAREALDHPSLVVRRAAAHVLRHLALDAGGGAAQRAARCADRAADRCADR